MLRVRGAVENSSYFDGVPVLDSVKEIPIAYHTFNEAGSVGEEIGGLSTWITLWVGVITQVV